MALLADIVIRSAAASLLLLLAGVFLRKHHAGWPGRCSALLAASLACHLACPFLMSASPFNLIAVPVWFGCIGVPAFFWMFVRAIFDDAFKPGIPEAAAFGIIELAGFGWLTYGRDMAAQGSMTFASLLQLPGLLLIVAALVRTWTGYPADLIEGRRRFRRWLVSGVGIYMVIVVSLEMILRGQPAPPVLDVVHGTIVLAITVTMALRLLEPMSNILWDRRPTASDMIDPADRMLAQRLAQTMDQERRYREEGLTIGTLADHLGEQEYRLRRVINGSLGFRNFNTFVNGYRIREACRRLGDPAEARLPVLSIALDLGFGSIGPFNRAFKETTGYTPTEYRRARLDRPRTE